MTVYSRLDGEEDDDGGVDGDKYSDDNDGCTYVVTTYVRMCV